MFDAAGQLNSALHLPGIAGLRIERWRGLRLLRNMPKLNSNVPNRTASAPGEIDAGQLVMEKCLCLLRQRDIDRQWSRPTESPLRLVRE